MTCACAELAGNPLPAHCIALVQQGKQYWHAIPQVPPKQVHVALRHNSHNVLTRTAKIQLFSTAGISLILGIA